MLPVKNFFNATVEAVIYPFQEAEDSPSKQQGSTLRERLWTCVRKPNMVNTGTGVIAVSVMCFAGNIFGLGLSGNNADLFMPGKVRNKVSNIVTKVLSLVGLAVGTGILAGGAGVTVLGTLKNVVVGSVGFAAEKTANAVVSFLPQRKAQEPIKKPVL